MATKRPTPTPTAPGPAIDTKAIAIVERQLAPLLVTAKNMRIETPQHAKDAALLITQINKHADQWKKLKETATVPMNAALKAVRELFKPKELAIEEVLPPLKRALSMYQLEQERIVTEQIEKIAARVAAGRGHLKPETAVAKIDSLERPESQIDVDGGSIKFRTDRVLRITDIKVLIHDIVKHELYELLTVDERAVLVMLKQGIVVRGVKIEEVKTIVNKR